MHGHQRELNRPVAQLRGLRRVGRRRLRSETCRELHRGRPGATPTTAVAGGGLIGLTKMLGHSLLVELIGLALDDRDGIARALTEAVAETVAEIICHQSRLAVDDLNGAFLTGWNA